MEKWLVSPDQDICWIMKENLRKARLRRMDSHWVTDWFEKLGGWTSLVASATLRMSPTHKYKYHKDMDLEVIDRELEPRTNWLRSWLGICVPTKIMVIVYGVLYVGLKMEIFSMVSMPSFLVALKNTENNENYYPNSNASHDSLRKQIHGASQGKY
jgi:hypothetical protein